MGILREEHGGLYVTEGSGRDGGVNRRALAAAAGLCVVIVAWALVNLFVEGMGFPVIDSEKVRGGEEAASALARLFGALVLGLFLTEDTGHRIWWAAGGLVVLGTAHLVFGYLEPLIQDDPPELNEALYEGFVATTFACALFALGLFPVTPPRLLVRAMTILPAALVGGYLVVFELLDGEAWMPPLARVDSPQRALELSSSFAWLTPWHWVLWTLPLGLTLVALLGAFWQSSRGRLRGSGCSSRWC